ncbi:Uncharacterized protein GBIM_09211, partial [Gryllus bimaculatus]
PGGGSSAALSSAAGAVGGVNGNGGGGNGGAGGGGLGNGALGGGGGGGFFHAGGAGANGLLPGALPDFRVAQSGDATCNGLFSPNEGSRTMTLRKAAASPLKCRFPQWLTVSLHWHTLDYSRIYAFSHRNYTLRISNASAPLRPAGGPGAGAAQQPA